MLKDIAETFYLAYKIKFDCWKLRQHKLIENWSNEANLSNDMDESNSSNFSGYKIGK